VLLFVALYVGLVQFYSWGWLLTPQLTYPSTAFVPKTRVTVLVPARNEAQQLQGLVEHLLQQAYPAALLEFIIINDHSTDDTLAQANTLAHTCPNPQGFSIRVLTLPGQLQGKKAALAHGVAHATGSLIITTDADCQMGPHWVAALVQYYQEHTHRVILGPVAMCPPHAPLQSRVLYHFQSLDLMGLMFITAGSLRFKFPHMANGANFAFEKQPHWRRYTVFAQSPQPLPRLRGFCKSPQCYCNHGCRGHLGSILAAAPALGQQKHWF
jgi:poly-beta-1,6-N-acetyl-D-glucosamine synthase